MDSVALRISFSTDGKMAPLFPVSDIRSSNLTVATADGLYSPISLSSGYCSDDDGDEMAAVRRGRDCWLPSTVVEPMSTAERKVKRCYHRLSENHSRINQHLHQSSRRRRSSRHHQVVDLDECLDPFRVLGVEDPFAVADDDDDRLPPLQVDPRLSDCDDSHDSISHDDVSVAAPSSGVLDSSLSSKTDALSSHSVIDNWLYGGVAFCSPPRDPEPPIASIKRVHDIDNSGTDSLKTVGQSIGRCLLADLLLGLVDYRTAKCSPRTCVSMSSNDDKNSSFDENSMSAKSDTQSESKRLDEKVSSSSSDIQLTVSIRRKSCCDDSRSSSTAVKRSLVPDTSSMSADNTLFGTRGNKLLKLSSANAEEDEHLCIVTSRDSIAVTAALPVTRVDVREPSSRDHTCSDCLYSNGIEQHLKNIGQSDEGSPASMARKESHARQHLSTESESSELLRNFCSSNVMTLIAPAANVDVFAKGGSSVILEAMLRTTSKLDANKGSDATSVLIKDGLPVAIDNSQPSPTLIRTTIATAVSEAEVCQRSPASSEPGLLHRLLTGQVDEADIYRAAEAEAKGIDTSRIVREHCPPPNDCCLLGTSTNVVFDELDMAQSNDDVFDQQIVQSVDEIIATIGIQDAFLDCYLHDILSTLQH